ncbi:FkbM family methyltransferase [Helicobacter brantae]|uniref:SAM-dependent methyltransferase n=1 Tax=Helicobacter brantae TaxID=375927 RepID=A0A3D8J3V9_9HELI|nr:FkbM family methyltransferase [Helicobacter brantae]RDU72202.1 SAM-dependent methyltransferase [Helicobacter brantae]
MKQVLKKIPFVKKIYQWTKNTLKLYSTQSFSQEGEDLILKRIFERQKKGFYVDVGAHHPFRFSNTYLFYKKGWRGINLDAMPESMKLFKKYRPRDINLEIPIGESDRELTYHIFNEPALNTFDASRIQEILKNPEFTLIKKIQIQIKSLKDILDQYLPKNQQIDFLSVDVEGLDFEVLKSNDWQKYRPKILLVESLGGGGIKEFLHSEVYLFLSSQDYEVFAKTFNTIILRDKN